MPLPLCSVLCRVQLQEGGPDVGAIVIAKLNSFEVYDGYVVPQITQGTTDENGEVTLDLFPNELGSVESAYDVTITSRTGKKLRVTAVVPNNTDANLHEIAVLPVFPGKVDGQLALEAVLQVGEEANQAAIDAQNASSDAQAAAINAASSQAAAQGSETAASNSASSASASASTATAQAGIATTQAGIATTQAGIATAQVASIDLPTIARTTGDQTIGGIKTFSSSPVVPVATQDGQAVQRGQVVLRTGGALTGHLETVAGASGNQVPRASETVRLSGGAAALPVWDTAGRPASPASGHSGVNSDHGAVESFVGGVWKSGAMLETAPVATTSGTSHVFNAPPGSVRGVRLWLDLVSTNGSQDMLVQLGTGGALVATGYGGTLMNLSTGALVTSTAGMPVRGAGASDQQLAFIECRRVPGTNRWLMKGDGRRNSTGTENTMSAEITLAGAIDRIGLVRQGADVFDAGQAWAEWIME